MNNLRLLVLLALLIVSGANVDQVFAETKLPPAKVAILDYQSLMRNSVAANQIRNDIKKLRQRYKKNFQKIEKTLLAQRRKLLLGKKTMTAKEFETKRRAFEKTLIQTQREAQDRSRQLDRIFSAAMAKVQAAIVPIVKQYTIKFDANLVVDNTQVFFAAKTLDITKSVLASLNSRLKRVAVKVPNK